MSFDRRLVWKPKRIQILIIFWFFRKFNGRNANPPELLCVLFLKKFVIIIEKVIEFINILIEYYLRDVAYVHVNAMVADIENKSKSNSIRWI